MSEKSDSMVLSPFFLPCVVNDCEERHNTSLTTDEDKNEYSSTQDDENLVTKKLEVANLIVLSPFFESPPLSEHEEVHGTNDAISEDENGVSSSQDKETFKIKNSKKTSHVAESVIHNSLSQSGSESKRKYERNLIMHKNESKLSSSQNAQNLPVKNCKKMSIIADPVFSRQFFQPNSSCDFSISKKNGERSVLKLSGHKDKNESSDSQMEKNFETTEFKIVNGSTDLVISSSIFGLGSLTDIDVKTECEEKPNVNFTSCESKKELWCTPCEENFKTKNFGEENGVQDAVTPSPFVHTSDISAVKEDDEKPDVKSTDWKEENDFLKDAGPGEKSSVNRRRKPRRRLSTVKKNPGCKKVVTSPYFAVKADSPKEENVKHDNNQRISKKWIPPRSPYALIQEDLYNKPWQLLIATIFLTKTRGQLAIPYIHKFLGKWPTPEKLLEANFEEVHEIFKPLGLGMVRSCSVFRFTKEYLEKDWRYPIELHGIGKYGNDSYRMFCVNEWREVTPTDIPLSMYKEWLTLNQEKLGLNQ